MKYFVLSLIYVVNCSGKKITSRSMFNHIQSQEKKFQERIFSKNVVSCNFWVKIFDAFGIIHETQAQNKSRNDSHIKGHNRQLSVLKMISRNLFMLLKTQLNIAKVFPLSNIPQIAKAHRSISSIYIHPVERQYSDIDFRKLQSCVINRRSAVQSARKCESM